jgi:hypothetical protein
MYFLFFLNHFFIAQRKGGSAIFKSHASKRVAPAKFRTLDYNEREGYIILKF